MVDQQRSGQGKCHSPRIKCDPLRISVARAHRNSGNQALRLGRIEKMPIEALQCVVDAELPLSLFEMITEGHALI
jgi:hypothetical protein